MKRNVIMYDVVIVGAGPSGLAAAIRLRQLAESSDTPSVCVIEKGSEVGAHIISGAVFEPRALNELLPNWRKLYQTSCTRVKKDSFLLLSEHNAFRLPMLPMMCNNGNYIASLGNMCRWLAHQAEALGVDIYPGFSAADILYDSDGRVCGIVTGDMGLDKDRNPTSTHTRGIKLHAKFVLFAEGCRGYLTEKLIEHFDLRKGRQPQTYGIGLKELWEIDPVNHRKGSVIHSVGWPLDRLTYGGSFLYHLDNYQLAVGMVIGLDYKNPYLSPFVELQRFKQHPAIRPLFKGGRRVAYGARAINEGGWQSIPRLSFPGGALIGCSAGFVNVPKMKGVHTAMKSGMIAAELLHDMLLHGEEKPDLTLYESALRTSWIGEELRSVRNIRPGFRHGLWWGLFNAALDSCMLRGRAPWTLRNNLDHKSLVPAKKSSPIAYPRPDGIVSFDIQSSLFISNTKHAKNQPTHLHLDNPNVAININWAYYQSPEQRYCPAGVYEIVKTLRDELCLRINAQNCLHCKVCDIKDPTQNITWRIPQGGDGPNYYNM